ncbi:PadR family transcriptional regulator [candidate division KSB1 bacterium]
MKLLSRSEEIALLAIWRLNGNAYGVTIRDIVNELTGKDWSFGAIYVPLDKLTQKGFVLKQISEPGSGRGERSRCLYELTSTGKAALKEIREIQDSLWEGISSIAFD